MSSSEPIDPGNLDLDIPPRLAEDLRALGGSGPIVPPAFDTAILAAARLHLGRRARPGRTARILRWAVPAAAAAAVLLLLKVTMDSRRPAAPPPLAGRTSASGIRNSTFDIDHSGRIDILDAFALARRLERGEATDPAWDRTGDGAVDRKDVDAIALAAVKVTE